LGDYATVGAKEDDDKGNGSGSAYLFKNDAIDPPLPVELSSFSGISINSGVLLKWQTASKKNNAGFVLYRNGVEIASYENTTELKGHSTTSDATNYEWLAEQHLFSPDFFRQLFFNQENDAFKVRLDHCHKNVEALNLRLYI